MDNLSYYYFLDKKLSNTMHKTYRYKRMIDRMGTWGFVLFPIAIKQLKKAGVVV